MGTAVIGATASLVAIKYQPWVQDDGVTLTNLYTRISEQPASDANYIQSPPNPCLSSYVARLGIIPRPVSGTIPLHTRASKDLSVGTVDYTVTVLQGSNVIQSFTHPNISTTWTQFDDVVSPIQLFDDAYVSFSTPNNGFSGMNLGTNFHVTTSGLFAVAVHYWKPSVATFGQLDFGLFRQSDGAILMHQTLGPLVTGWNTLPFTPVPLDVGAVYQIGYQTSDNWYWIDDDGVLTGRSTGPLVADLSNWDFNWPNLANSGLADRFYGVDVVVSNGVSIDWNVPFDVQVTMNQSA